jgi:hypothetical protein
MPWSLQECSRGLKRFEEGSGDHITPCIRAYVRNPFLFKLLNALESSRVFKRIEKVSRRIRVGVKKDQGSRGFNVTTFKSDKGLVYVLKTFRALMC